VLHSTELLLCIISLTQQIHLCSLMQFGALNSAGFQNLLNRKSVIITHKCYLLWCNWYNWYFVQ